MTDGTIDAMLRLSFGLVLVAAGILLGMCVAAALEFWA